MSDPHPPSSRPEWHPPRRARPPRSGEDPIVLQRFEGHLDLADRLARRYVGSDNADDLRQVARVGLLLAARRYDEQRGPFERFAIVTIVGELKKYLRSNGWAVHVPRRVQEDSIAVARTVEQLEARLQRPPTLLEIANASALTLDRVSGALRAGNVRFKVAVTDATPEPADGADTAESALTSVALAQLDPGDRALFELAFNEGLSQREIGDRLGITQTRVHRRLQFMMSRLRRMLAVAAC